MKNDVLQRPPGIGALFVRNTPVDQVALGIEQALVEDGFYLLMEGDETPSERTIHLALVAEAWVGVWDPLAIPGQGFPDGDLGSSLAQALSATTGSAVLHVFGYASGFGEGWGYLLHASGLPRDRFATDPRRFATAFDLEDADVDGLYRGAPERLAPMLAPGVDEEEVVGALVSGEDALREFLRCLGIPPAVALGAASLAPAERELTLALPFAPRV